LSTPSVVDISKNKHKTKKTNESVMICFS